MFDVKGLAIAGLETEMSLPLRNGPAEVPVLQPVGSGEVRRSGVRCVTPQKVERLADPPSSPPPGPDD